MTVKLEHEAAVSMRKLSGTLCRATVHQ